MEQRLVGVRAPRGHAVRGAVRRHVRPVPPLPRRPRAPGGPRLRGLPVLRGVVAHRAGGRRVLGRRARTTPGLAACHEHGILPVVTYHHFTTPAGPPRRTAGPTRRSSTASPASASGPPRRWATSPASRARSTSPTSCRLWATSSVRSPRRERPRPLRDGQRALRGRARKAHDAIKAGPATRPSACAWRWRLVVTEGYEETLANVRHMHEGQFLEAARHGDFVGVQAYSRTRLDEQGMPLGPEEGVETLDMGYEYWPQALEVSIRYAAEVSGRPVYVTENGIGTTDDEQRIRRARRPRRRGPLPTTASTCAATSTGRCSTTSSGCSATCPASAWCRSTAPPSGARSSPRPSGWASSPAPTASPPDPAPGRAPCRLRSAAPLVAGPATGTTDTSPEVRDAAQPAVALPVGPWRSLASQA